MKAIITIDDEKAELVEVFEAELKTTINDRATYTVSHVGKKTKFNVQAKDSVALRATLNAITKQLVVFSKMKGL